MEFWINLGHFYLCGFFVSIFGLYLLAMKERNSIFFDLKDHGDILASACVWFISFPLIIFWNIRVLEKK